MNRSIKTVSIFLFLFIAIILIASDSFMLTSKYGEILTEVDQHVRWEFFHEQLLTTEEAAAVYTSGELVEKLPHRFDSQYSTPQTYGSYVTKLTLPDELVNQKIAFYIPYQFGSYELYVDGQLVAQNGTVGESREQQQPRNAPTIGQVTLANKEVFVVMQLANFYSDRGGFAQPIQIGEPLKMIERYNSSIILYFFVNGIIFVIGLYMLSFGLFNRRNVPTVLFALFSLTIAIRSLFARPYIYSITIFNIPWEHAAKIEMICTMLSTGLAIRFCYYWFATYLSPKALTLMYSVGAIQLVITLFTDAVFFQNTFSFLYWVPIAVWGCIVAVALKRHHDLMSFNLLQFLGMCIIFIATVHDFIVTHLMLDNPVLVHVAVGIYITLQVVVMSWQYAQKLQEAVSLNQEIMELNMTLDVKIQERTKELEAANAKLEVLASHDALTSIGNRHLFNLKLQAYFENAQQNGSYLSLMLIDLDSFKKYNDYYGHTLGDVMLQKVVKIVGNILPEEAIFTRYGGEEFAVIVPDMTKEEFIQLGHKIVVAVAQEQLEHVGQESGIVTVSVGGYTMTSADNFFYTTQLIDAADKQLYLAKRSGKNMFMIV